jgi:hypothetical protein
MGFYFNRVIIYIKKIYVVLGRYSGYSMSLLSYCELDTLAMVMIVEAWNGAFE